MASCNLKNIRIAGVCTALPDRKTSLKDLDIGMDDRAKKRFMKNTGVDIRYLSESQQCTSDLCYVAAEELLKKKDINKTSIDALIYVSQNPDYLRPATAIIMQARLGLSKECLAFDINLGCSGYIYGLYVAATMLTSGTVNRVLLLAGDVNHNITEDYLFGDAGSATVIEHGEYNMDALLRSDGFGYQAIIAPVGGQRHPFYPGYDPIEAAPRMFGADVFQFSITEVPQMIKDFFATFDVGIDDFDFFVMHQANLMILEQIRKKIEIPVEKFPISIGKYGNVSSASVPLALTDLCPTLPIGEYSMFMSGFGIGLSWGAVSIKLESDVVLSPVFTNYFWDEKFENGEH